MGTGCQPTGLMVARFVLVSMIGKTDAEDSNRARTKNDGMPKEPRVSALRAPFSTALYTSVYT